MRKQIAAANWKMNLSLQESVALVSDLLKTDYSFTNNQLVLLAVPFPYLLNIQQKISGDNHFSVCSQNCAATENGAYTGEVSTQMLNGMGIGYSIIGHSERRLYYQEDNSTLANKINVSFKYGVQPVFCCGEPLEVREKNAQNDFVQLQLEESLFHLKEDQMTNFIIAYEPIWAIGTGRTATSDQAQHMHAHIRAVIEKKYGNDIATSVSILYGGSVKASNAKELFSLPDVDGGLVGGASLIASEFSEIIKSLKK